MIIWPTFESILLTKITRRPLWTIFFFHKSRKPIGYCTLFWISANPSISDYHWDLVGQSQIFSVENMSLNVRKWSKKWYNDNVYTPHPLSWGGIWSKAQEGGGRWWQQPLCQRAWFQFGLYVTAGQCLGGKWSWISPVYWDKGDEI